MTFYISGSIKKIEEIVAYFSKNKKTFEDGPKFDKNVVVMASNLTKSNFKHIDRDTVLYKGKASKFKLNLKNESCYNNCSCNCGNFMKEAVCMHILGYSNIHELNLCGDAFSTKPSTFAHKMRRGRARGTNCYGEKKK